jgi:PAS domain S-box-containing protein
MPDAPASLEFAGGIGPLSREMLAAVFDQSADCVKILDREGRIEFINSNGVCNLEIDDFATIVGRPWTALWPEDSQDDVTDAIAAAQAGRPSRFEAFCPTAKGSPKWWDVSVAPVRDREGQIFAILSTSRDVTVPREAMERMETMAHEMRHRLRNAFAIGGAIIRASGREEPEHAEFAADLAQRLQTLSSAQASLLDSDSGEPLERLISRIVEGFDPGGERIAIAALPRVSLDEQQARLVALVVSELATNSLKHGALGAGLAIAVGGEDRDGRLELEWSEALPVPASPVRVGEAGSGYGLMQRMARAHGGAFEVDFADRRLSARLDLPLGEAARG